MLVKFFNVICKNGVIVNNIYLIEGRRRQWHPTPVLLPGKSHGWRSLMGCSPWGREESDTTERLHFHFSLSCIGEGNGNPLQCPCLENPRDRGAWWATIYGVAQSRTWLKRLSSRVHHAKCQAGWITSLIQDCWEKYQQPQICRQYQPNDRKQRGNKSLLMKVKKENENARLKLNIFKTMIMAFSLSFHGK